MPELLTPDEERWHSPGFLAEATLWCDEVLAARGRVRTGRVEQPRVRMWATSLRMPTDSGDVWFKDNCPGQRAEAGVVAVLARLVPDRVVEPLGVDAVRGWMLSPDQGRTLGEAGHHDEATWTRVLAEYARLQRATVAHRDELVAAGLQPLVPEEAATLLGGELDRLATLPAGHPRRLPDELTDRLRALLPAVTAVGERLAAGPVPCALDHNDLHQSNAFAPGDGPLRFFDLGDAVWAHPFGSLRVPMNVIGQAWGVGDDDPALQRVVGAYLAEWADLAPVEELRALLADALVLSRLHRYLAWDRCLAAVPPDLVGDWAEAPVRWLDELAGSLGRHAVP